MRWPTRTAARRRLRARSGHDAGSGSGRGLGSPDSPFDGSSALACSEPGLEPAVVGFDPVVFVLAGVVKRGRNQLLDHVGQRRCPVGDDLARVAVDSQGKP